MSGSESPGSEGEQIQVSGWLGACSWEKAVAGSSHPGTLQFSWGKLGKTTALLQEGWCEAGKEKRAGESIPLQSLEGGVTPRSICSARAGRPLALRAEYYNHHAESVGRCLFLSQPPASAQHARSNFTPRICAPCGPAASPAAFSKAEPC